MSKAEIPQKMTGAADEAMRLEAASHATGIMQLSDLQEFLVEPTETENVANVLTLAETTNPESARYENLSRIDLLMKINALEIEVRVNPELKAYLDKTFPNGHVNAPPLNRLYIWDAFETEKAEARRIANDERVLEAQRYQIRQLDAPKIALHKQTWGEKAAANLVEDTDAQIAAIVQRDFEIALVENEQRLAARRSEIAQQRALQEIETYTTIDEFIEAFTKANYSLADINREKPVETAKMLKSLFNGWEKTGVVGAKSEDTAAPVPMATIRKAIQSKRRQLAPVILTEKQVDAPIDPAVAPAEPDENDATRVMQSAGARAFGQLHDPFNITAVSVAALDGEVTQRVVIKRPEVTRK